MLENIVSIGSGVAIYLFLEYVWRPYIKPKFDRKFLSKSNHYLHQDIKILYTILNQDWISQHILPSKSAYIELFDSIVFRLDNYISQKECDNLKLVFDKLNYIVNDKPKPIEIVEADNLIHSTILVMLRRIASQVPPYTKID